MAATLAKRFDSRLRVLAYHGVPDPAVLGRQLDYLAADYDVVSGSRVGELFDGCRARGRPVWLTFDDGRPDVVQNALPELERRGLPATMFVCPGLVDRPSPFWWTTVASALRRRGSLEFGGRTWTGVALVSALKRVPDGTRRSFVASLDDFDDVEVSVDRTDLRRWTDAGLEVGNHTWDHPCLDRCEPAEQDREITIAHETLTDLLGAAPSLFAYPNGDHTDRAQQVLHRLGYRAAALFDHRLARLDGDRLRISRLRVDADDPIERFRAMVSGGHSAAFAWRDKARTLTGRARG